MDIQKGDVVQIWPSVVWSDRGWEVRESDGCRMRVRPAGLPEDCGVWGEWVRESYARSITRNGVTVSSRGTR